DTDFTRLGLLMPIPQVRECLERVVGTFTFGYNAALFCGDPERLMPELSEVPGELLGFAGEGSGMGFALLDILTPWRRDRFDRLLAGCGKAHSYLALCGYGWAVARLGRSVE